MRTVSDTDFPTLAFRIEPYVMDTALDVFGDQWTSGYPVTCGLTADQPKRTVGDQALHDAFNAVNIGIFPESVPDLGWRNGKPSEDVRAQFMIHYDGKGNATANAKNVAWRTLRDLMKSGEHHEYRMIDDKTIISIAGVLKES
jgi:hypothetical protein